VGERGTGKELVASYIHQKSRRASGPFIAVNCAAFSGNLLESEMFGHEKGAFTGAGGRKLGRFELADGGSLFLDEIGNMSEDFQEMILRVVEYQKFERVQGTETVEVDVRLLAATNADMEAMMERGDFRRDLYDRLAFKTITVPPLRERAEDIPALVDYFLEELQREVPSIGRKHFSPSALEKIQEFSWPGNVRQLKNVVERLALESPGDEITPGHLGLDERTAQVAGKSLIEKVDNFEKTLVQQALASAGGNQRAAARALGITYDQFRHCYKKFGLKGGA
jgi:DNA-binding NtrC family response regulator